MIKKFQNKIKYLSGMTLIELMVVIAIFTMITTITIFDYGSFNSGAAINNLGDDVALSIRKAQSYAIGTHQSSGEFDVGYGVHFTTSPAKDMGNYNKLAGSNKSFILYTDFSSGSTGYKFPLSSSQSTTCGQATHQNECMEMLNIGGNSEIKSISIDKGNGKMTPISEEGALNIVFKRPNPDALFCYTEKNKSEEKCLFTPNSISRANIIISNGQDGAKEKTKTISIYNTGQIDIN